MWPFHRVKENPVNRAIVALIGGSSVAWTPDNFRALSEQGYEACAVVYACVKLIAQTASRVPWYVARMDAQGNMKEFDRHPLIDFLHRPNEVEGGAMFTEKVLSYLLLNGNSYIIGVRGTASSPPQFMYCFRPDRVTIKPDRSGQFLVGGYRYDTGMGPQDFLPDDVLHLMEFHPTDDWYGLSRLHVAQKQIDVLNKAAAWNAKLLDNDMRPSGMMTAPTFGDIDQFKRAVRENFQGYQNAGLPLVIDKAQDITWTQLSVNPKDVDWLKGQQWTMRQIASIFGVDSCLVGDMEYATYSNKQEARKALYMEVVLPLMDLLKDEYQRWLVPYYGQGIVLDYDKDTIDELQEDREKQYTYLDKARWLTINEKRLATGYDERPDGDVYDKPAPPAPFGQAPAQEPTPPPPKKMATKQWHDPDAAKALWTAFDTRAKTREKPYLELAKSYLAGQAERIKARIKGSDIHRLSAGHIFSHGDETKAYVEHFWPWYKDHFVRAGNAGKHAAKGEIFNDGAFKADAPTSWTFTMTPEQERMLRAMVFESGTRVNKTTLEAIYDELLDAQANNKTVAAFAQAIGDKIDEFSRGRAALWASTESCKVDNAGQFAGYKDTEFVDGKMWICSLLPTSRDDHVDAHLQEVGIDDYFDIGGESLQYPGDPSGTPDELCNCRCSMAPIVGYGG